MNKTKYIQYSFLMYALCAVYSVNASVSASNSNVGLTQSINAVVSGIENTLGVSSVAAENNLQSEFNVYNQVGNLPVVELDIPSNFDSDSEVAANNSRASDFECGQVNASLVYVPEDRGQEVDIKSALTEDKNEGIAAARRVSPVDMLRTNVIAANSYVVGDICAGPALAEDMREEEVKRITDIANEASENIANEASEKAKQDRIAQETRKERITATLA